MLNFHILTSDGFDPDTTTASLQCVILRILPHFPTSNLEKPQALNGRFVLGLTLVWLNGERRLSLDPLATYIHKNLQIHRQDGNRNCQRRIKISVQVQQRKVVQEKVGCGGGMGGWGWEGVYFHEGYLLKCLPLRQMCLLGNMV